MLVTGEGSAQGVSLGHAGSTVQGAADCQLLAVGSSAAHPSGSQLESHEWLESGVHQAARTAIFQAAMGLLKPKLAQPVLVNFMSVAGRQCVVHCGTHQWADVSSTACFDVSGPSPMSMTYT